MIEAAWADLKWICLALERVVGAGASATLGLIGRPKLDEAAQFGCQVQEAGEGGLVPTLPT